MVHNFSTDHSLISNWVSELRSTGIQLDRMRFRRNLERIAEVIGYEISKGMATEEANISTPMGSAKCKVMKEQPVLATILRAGLAMHNGLLSYFDRADNAFLSAYRKHNEDGSFEIALEYMSCPAIEGRVVIVSDPMLATGASLVKAIQYLREAGKIKELHVVCAIAATKGIKHFALLSPTYRYGAAPLTTSYLQRVISSPVSVMRAILPTVQKCRNNLISAEYEGVLKFLGFNY